MLKDELIEHESIKGFFKHPTHEQMFVSRSGLVYNNATGFVVEQRQRGKYFVALGIERHVHLLVCETFLDVPAHLKECRLVVNHKNGITVDNSVDNLEWVTYSENATHAYRTGLRPDNTPILIKDLRSGEIVRHYSLQQAARAHSVNGASIHWFLKPENFGKVFRKFFIVKREDGDWPNVNQSSMNPLGSGYERAIYVEIFKTGERFMFRNVAHAAEHLEIKSATLHAKLRRSISKGLLGHTEETFGVWYFDTCSKEIQSSAQSIPARLKKLSSKRPIRKPVPIIVTDLVTGEKETVASCEIYARRLGVRKNTFQKHIYKNNGIWKSKIHVHYCE